MRLIKRTILLATGMLLAFAGSISAQDVPVDYSKYPDYTDFFNPDKSFYTYGQGPQMNIHGMRRVTPKSERPDHVDNSKRMFFPPVFNQSGGSCGSASRICYMFTYELNCYRNLNGKDPKNYYPSHFVWLLTNGNSGKDQFVQFVGVPSAATYGGQTYSSQFGYKEETNDDFGWMTGYDKWFEAMHNRMWAPTNIPVAVGTEEGREMLKNWLWNHNGDNDFQAGGVAGIGVASGGNWQNIPKSANNDAIGVTGMKYVKAWGTSIDHALTIVGYDDRVEFDLDGDGKVGEKDEDEVGAWIIVNSWGAGWCNQGFIYCPYKHAVPSFTSDGKPNGGGYCPELYHVRKDYKPERTIKLKMDYNRRSEIALSAGISTNLNATAPDQTIPMHHFQYAGDGHNGNSNPAPEIPMLGRWADGKLHDEPMEFGYDLTDLTAGANRNQPIKYFFIVNTKSWAQGSGHIYGASIIDYKLDPEGLETPFDCSDASPVEIKSAGKKTIISVIVYGDGYTDPRNLVLNENKLEWEAPAASGHKLDSYNIYADGVKIANTKQTSYSLETVNANVYGVAAVYSDGNEGKLVTVNAPVVLPEKQTVYEFTQSGFSIPDVFKSNYSECTIEFLIRPKSLLNWNQSAGPGWGTFMMHANSDGRFTAGWNTGDRTNSNTGSLKTGTWTHVAVVIKNNTLKIYIDGQQSGSTLTSNSYSGIGGFGDFTFTANSGNNANLNAYMDEIRIWNYAREQKQISSNRIREFHGSMMPDGLLAYYKGGTISRDGKTYLLDVVGGHHAVVLNDAFKTNTTTVKDLKDPGEKATVVINKVDGDIVAGLPVTMSATCATSIQRLVWTCADAGIDSTRVMRPTFVFPKAGDYAVQAIGFSYAGDVVKDTMVVKVGVSADVDASFHLSKSIIPAGEHVTFVVNNPVTGNIYHWEMPGARKETASTVMAGATYDMQGKYTVTLTVTTPDGKSATSSKEIEVTKVAPKSDFRITPDVIIKGEKTYLVDETKYDPTSWTWTIASKAKTYVVNGQNSSFTPDKAGIYDVTLTTSNDIGQSSTTKTNALYVCNADSKNGLSLMGYNAAQVTAKSPLEAGGKYFTIEFWMEQPAIADASDGIGDERSTLLLEAYSYGAFVLWLGDASVASNDEYILKTGWHHYAITYNSGTVKFFRDGEQFGASKTISVKTLPELSRFRIGGSDYSFGGRIDEFRVWNKALTLSRIQKYCVEPITDIAAAEELGLCLYYDFNQSSGDVQDRSTNANHGVRTGFGPEGDAWGLSTGVFALNFEKSTFADVTSKYLKNYKKNFATASGTVNPSNSSRFLPIKDWTLENQVVEGNVKTGAHVDTNKGYSFTSTSTWDGFAGTLANHKAFQTITLPAGLYKFTANYGSYEGQCGSSYLVAAAGKTLPNTDEIATAIGYTKMVEKGSVTSNELIFAVGAETEVSLGLLINQSGKQCMTIDNFKLEYNDEGIIEADGQLPDAIEDIPAALITPVKTGTYDLQGRRIDAPTRPGLYIINGKKVVIK